MKNGEVFVIKVTDVMDLTYPYDIGEVISGYDTRLDGFTINLFDYGPESTLDAGDNNLESHGWQLNSGINSGHNLKFTSYGRAPWNVLTNGNKTLTQNHFSGGDATTQGIVKKVLNNSG